VSHSMDGEGNDDTGGVNAELIQVGGPANGPSAGQGT
jgi:hypothetical protein